MLSAEFRPGRAIVCTTEGLGVAESEKRRPYVLLGILGAALIGGAALIYRDAKRRGE